MLDRILAALAVALIEHLAARAERGKIAVDASTDLARLHRAGDRIREWMRQNDPGVGGKPDQDRTTG